MEVGGRSWTPRLFAKIPSRSHAKETPITRACPRAITILDEYFLKPLTIIMLIGLCGGKVVPVPLVPYLKGSRSSYTYNSIGICAGKNSVADYLTENHGFMRLHLAQHPHTLPEVKQQDAKERSFACVASLLDFVTKYWQQRWVTTDVWNENILENLLRRPSFILVSVDAPVSLRWKRLKNR